MWRRLSASKGWKTESVSPSNSSGRTRNFSHSSMLKAGVAFTHLPSSHSSAKRSEEHTSELQSLMRISYAAFCLTKKSRFNLNKHAHYLISTTQDTDPLYTQDTTLTSRH